MQAILIDNLTLAGSPVGWALVILLAVLIFAPNTLPAIARMIGRLFRTEVQRRTGIPLGPPPRRVRQPVAVEVLPPDPPPAHTPPPAPQEIIQEAPRPAGAPWWVVGVLTGALALVLAWTLLQTR